MIYFRLSRLAALLTIIAAIARAIYFHDVTRWSFSLFLIYGGILIFTISKYAQGNLAGQVRYNRFGSLLLFTSLSLYLTYAFHSLITFIIGSIASGWGAALLVDHFNDHRSAKARNKIAGYFLISDISLLSVAIYATTHHLDLFATTSMPLAITLLLSLSGLIKSGVFPFHRWLALTNEAPSPLSALLHAGIVNGFGLMLISFPSLHQARTLTIALSLLSIASSLLIMRHRHDEKGKLANGTSMQMAYMAIEGALGLHGAVLLHIIGHGSYKSWSFLRVGGVPARWKKSQETFLPKNGSQRIMKSSISLLLVIGLAITVFHFRDFTLSACVIAIAATSYLLFISSLSFAIFWKSALLLLVGVFVFALESIGMSKLVPSSDQNHALELIVGFVLIALTIISKFIPREISLKASAHLLGFNQSGKTGFFTNKSVIASKISSLELAKIQLNSLLSTNDYEEALIDPAEIVAHLASYFEPGLDLSTMVAQDPISGLHHLNYADAANELAVFGISAYPVGDTSQSTSQTISPSTFQSASQSTSPSTSQSTSQQTSESIASPELDRVIDIASWWTAEACHNHGNSQSGPYSLWWKSSRSHRALPSDPEELLNIYLASNRGAESSAETAKDMIAKLIGIDLGWFQYLHGKHSDWLVEVVALRAALVMLHQVNLPSTTPVDVAQGEQILQERESAELSQLFNKISQASSHTTSQRSSTAVVACIDVRSEKLRRFLESQYQVDTLGFAGFFGADIALVTNDGSHRFENQMCPVILKPGIALSNTNQPKFLDLVPMLWSEANRGSGALAMAEGFGLIQLALSFLNTFWSRFWKAVSAKDLGKGSTKQLIDFESYQKIPLSQRTALANMLFENLPLASYNEVIFVGHESCVPNNPFTSLYECGACGGNSGLINAQYVAMLLTDKEVLAKIGRGEIETNFRYALHNTTEENIYFFLNEGGINTSPLKGKISIAEKKSESGAWWQPFPEFGLAGNVGAIIAPRSLTKDIELQGKYFLHDYDFAEDLDGQKLATILTGPGQVMQMINSQYNFTILDPKNFSSGDKTRLNVFTQAGALSGTGGALKRGMPWQAVGFAEDQSIHQPARLQILIHAPEEIVAKALAQTPLALLATNNWIGIHPIPIK